MGTSWHLTSDVLFAVKHISEWFPVGKLVGIGRKLGGSYNLNIKVETERGEFVVRFLSRNNTEPHLRYIQTALTSLSKQGVPVLKPLLAGSGDPFVRYKDKLLQVTPFVRAESFQCRPEQVLASARMLSRFHETLPDSPPGTTPGWSFYRPVDYYEDALDRLKDLSGIPRRELRKVERAAARILETWEKAEKALPTATIHGDWHFWNQLYRKDEVCSVMDFDFIQRGKRIHDVAYALWAIYILLPEHAKQFDQLFIQGYANLTEEEIQILPVAIAKVGLFFLCQCAYSSHSDEKWHRQYRKQMPLIQWLLEDGEQLMHDLVHGRKEEAEVEVELDDEAKAKIAEAMAEAEFEFEVAEAMAEVVLETAEAMAEAEVVAEVDAEVDAEAEVETAGGHSEPASIGELEEKVGIHGNRKPSANELGSTD